MRFTIRRYPAPNFSHNLGSFSAATGKVRVIVSEGLVMDQGSFKKLRTTYKLTPEHRINAGKQAKVVAINQRRQRALEYAGEVINEAA